jgi:hypothetical protein
MIFLAAGGEPVVHVRFQLVLHLENDGRLLPFSNRTPLACGSRAAACFSR